MKAPKVHTFITLPDTLAPIFRLFLLKISLRKIGPLYSAMVGSGVGCIGDGGARCSEHSGA